MAPNLSKAMGDEKVLDNFRKNKDVEGLIKGLKHWDCDLRARAAFYLGETNDPIAVEALIFAMENDDADHVKMESAKALAKIGDERAIGPLVKQSNKKESWMRRDIAESLGILGDERGIKPLIRLSKDQDEYVRIHAIRALGEFDNARVIKPLVNVWKKYRNKRNMNEGHIALDILRKIASRSLETRSQVIKQSNELECLICMPKK